MWHFLYKELKEPIDDDKLQLPLKVYQRCKEMGSKTKAAIWHSLDDNGLNWDVI